MIEIENGTFQVAAEEVAKGLRLSPDEVMQGLRDGSITSLCEAGRDADEGRHRLTFLSEGRRLRLIVDGSGAIITRSSSDFSRKGAKTGVTQSPSGGQGSLADLLREGNPK